jgi:short-chain 2-methylacyl-CoA dehydrogenase
MAVETDARASARHWLFTEEHERYRSAVAEFADRVLAPTVAERTTARTWDESLIPQLGELGVFGMRVTKEYGGQGADLTSMCLVLEELSRVDGSTANTVEAASVSAGLFDAMATDEQKRDVMPDIAAGKAFVAFGLTEPSGGSDAGNIATRARRDGDDWLITGRKEWITNPGTPFSRYVITFAATGEGKPGRPAVSAFLVPLDARGIELSPRYPKLGWAASDVRAIDYTDVRVPSSALLGTEGRGYREALSLVTWARLPLSAMGVGVMQGCVDATLQWVQERRSFGSALGSHQSVAFDLADMYAKLETGRSVTYDGAYRFDHGLPYEQHASVAKLMTSEFANEVGYRATQLHGAYGFANDTAAGRLYADARVLTIGEGPSEIQRMIIARGMGLPA